MSNQEFNVGSSVVFTGFKDSDLPDNGDLLEIGETYTVGEVVPETEEDDATYRLEVPNPDYDSSKRKSKANMPSLFVDCFADEIAVADEETPDTEENAVAWDEVSKGDYVAVVENNEEGTEWQGEVIKKTKTSMTILNAEEEEVAFKKAEVWQISIFDAESEDEESEDTEESTEEEEQQEEEKPAPKKKAAKKKAAAKKKTTSKPKEEEQEEEEEKEKASDIALDLKGLILLEDTEDDEEILEMYVSSEDPIALVQEVAQGQALTEYQLGGLIYHLRVSGDYANLDERYTLKGGFMLFCEDMLPVGYRKALYLSKIYSKWNKYGFDRELIGQVGWTKSAIIADNATDENAAEIIGLLEEDTSVENLKATVKETYATVGATTSGGERIRRKSFTYRIEEDAADTIENYMEMAANYFETDDLNYAFNAMVTDWAQNTLDMAEIKKNLRKVKARNKKKAAEKEEPKAAVKNTTKKAAPKKKTATKKKTSRK